MSKNQPPNPPRKDTTMTDTVTDQECPECGAEPDEQHDTDCREATRSPELNELDALLDEATGDQRVLLSLAYLGYLFKDAYRIGFDWADDADAPCLQVAATCDAAGNILETDPEDDCVASNLGEGNAAVWRPYLDELDDLGSEECFDAKPAELQAVAANMLASPRGEH